MVSDTAVIFLTLIALTGKHSMALDHNFTTSGQTNKDLSALHIPDFSRSHFESTGGNLHPGDHFIHGAIGPLDESHNSPNQASFVPNVEGSQVLQDENYFTNQHIGHCSVQIGGHPVNCFQPGGGDYSKKMTELQHHFPTLPHFSSGVSRCTTLRPLTRKERTLGSLFSQCVETVFVLRTPYFLYNTDKELRYIVQDLPHSQQCYVEARCSFSTRVCFRIGALFSTTTCRLKRCYHTLLAWDPSSPQLGTFFDTFPFACYCECPSLFNRG
ncbi:uncharacterized protein LOC143244689 [Tachypleus tridentatus]|uniref:uncharacterized protein LOC143244689 n=1 Tax=Tachypleus tridentatus TaxID=6853 RepID=UPI003FD1CEDC